MYIALEGVDTAGKSTQIDLLRGVFPEAFFTREPGGSVLGEELRKILLHSNLHLSQEAEFLLFLSDRAEHIHKAILPHRDTLIISDRSLISGIGYATQMQLQQAIDLNLYATNGVLPDLVVLLELTHQELQKRLGEKDQDEIEQRGVEFLLNVQKRMIEASERMQIKLLRIDARLSPYIIHQKIVEAIG